MIDVSLAQTSTSVSIALGVIALVGALVGYLRWLRPKYRRGKGELVKAKDSIIGRPAIVDSITGRVLAPELPGIGQRIESVERNQVETRDALRHIATLLESQQAQDHRLNEHESRLSRLEEAVVERVATKVESMAAWQAVAKVAESIPPADPASLD